MRTPKAPNTATVESVSYSYTDKGINTQFVIKVNEQFTIANGRLHDITKRRGFILVGFDGAERYFPTMQAVRVWSSQNVVATGNSEVPFVLKVEGGQEIGPELPTEQDKRAVTVRPIAGSEHEIKAETLEINIEAQVPAEEVVAEVTPELLQALLADEKPARHKNNRRTNS